METTDKKLYQAQVLALKDEVNTLKGENQRLHALLEQRNKKIVKLQAEKLELFEVLKKCKLAMQFVDAPAIKQELDLILLKYKGKIK